MRENHIVLLIFVILFLVDNAAFGHGFLAHYAQFQQFSGARFEDVVIVYGKQVRRWGGHVDLVVVWLWSGIY